MPQGSKAWLPLAAEVHPCAANASKQLWPSSSYGPFGGFGPSSIYGPFASCSPSSSHGPYGRAVEMLPRRCCCSSCRVAQLSSLGRQQTRMLAPIIKMQQVMLLDLPSGVWRQVHITEAPIDPLVCRLRDGPAFRHGCRHAGRYVPWHCCTALGSDILVIAPYESLQHTSYHSVSVVTAC